MRSFRKACGVFLSVLLLGMIGVSPIQPAFAKYAAEVAKLSDAEREAFKERWQPRFDAIGASMR